MGTQDAYAIFVIIMGALLVAAVVCMIFRFNPFTFIGRIFKFSRKHGRK